MIGCPSPETSPQASDQADVWIPDALDNRLQLPRNGQWPQDDDVPQINAGTADVGCPARQAVAHEVQNRATGLVIPAEAVVDGVPDQHDVVAAVDTRPADVTSSALCTGIGEVEDGVAQSSVAAYAVLRGRHNGCQDFARINPSAAHVSCATVDAASRAIEDHIAGCVLTLDASFDDLSEAVDVGPCAAHVLRPTCLTILDNRLNRSARTVAAGQTVLNDLNDLVDVHTRAADIRRRAAETGVDQIQNCSASCGTAAEASVDEPERVRNSYSRAADVIGPARLALLDEIEGDRTGDVAPVQTIRGLAQDQADHIVADCAWVGTRPAHIRRATSNTIVSNLPHQSTLSRVT